MVTASEVLLRSAVYHIKNGEDLLKETKKQVYMDGFRKAREMAYELMKENSDKRIFNLDVDIENLGEEIVE